jgi:cytochrome b561
MTGARIDAQTYGLVSRVNHWLFAAAMIFMLAFGFYVFEGMARGPDMRVMADLHKAIGVLILGVGLWRVGWRLVAGFPPEAGEAPRWQSRAAKAAHWTLLAAILVMPLSGLANSYFGGRAVDVFGLFAIPAGTKAPALAELAEGVHVAGAWALAAIVLAHVAGALKHHFIDRDDTLRRMVGRA